MSQSSAQRAETSSDSVESFSNKPVRLYDNGHGTKVNLWNNDGKNGEFQTVSIERSYKPKDATEFVTQKVSLNADQILAIARGLEKGHDAIVEKQIAAKQGATRS